MSDDLAAKAATLVKSVRQPEVPVLQLRGEDPTAQELALTGGDRQQVPWGVELGVADVQELAPGQGPGEELEVVQVAGHLGRVPVEREVADRHPAVPGHVEPELDLLDVLAAALGPPGGGPAGALSSSGISETRASVVNIRAEIDAAF